MRQLNLPALPRNLRGFTLIEMLTVIGILLVLALVAIIAFNSFEGTSRETAASANLHNFAKAILHQHLMDDQYELSRTTTLQALASANPPVVDGGVNANESFQIYGADHTPVDNNELAIAFAYSAQGVSSNNSGFYAILLTRGGGKLLAKGVRFQDSNPSAFKTVEVPEGSTPRTVFEASSGD